MKAYKEKQFLVFKFEDGKDVRYNLATGETIGKLGKPVKDICTQLRGYNLLEVIDSFENKNYSEFLKFIDKKFINRSHKHSYSGYRLTQRVNHISNVGSFLSRIKDYDLFEKYFAAGFYNIEPDIKYDFNDIPKGLIKLCKEFDLRLSNRLIEMYKDNPNLFNLLLSLDYLSLTKQQVLEMLTQEKMNTYRYRESQYNNKFYELLEVYDYNPKPLALYIDSLMTFEALEFRDILGELVDYVNMMSKISPKYDKYPRNFLTTHRIATRNYNRLKQEFAEESFKNRVNKRMEWSVDEYKIVYPDTTQDIKDEAVQQNNCVASYIDKVIDGVCDIVFLRRKDDVEHSLVTLEVRNNTVVQAKGKFNRDIYKEEQTIVDKYNKHLQNLFEKKEKIAC